MAWQIYSFADNTQLESALAKSLLAAINTDALLPYPTIALALTSHPRYVALFSLLSSMAAPWQRVLFHTIDALWLPPYAITRYQCLLRCYLLQNKARQARLLSLKTNHPTPEAAVVNVHKKLSTINSLSYTAMLLSMGNDGHFASFFAASSALSATSLQYNPYLCRVITPPPLPNYRYPQPYLPYKRLCLILTTILQSRRLFLHIVGESQWHILKRAFLCKDATLLPVSLLLHQTQCPLQIYYSPC